MEENIFIPEEQPVNKRPQFLSVLCILTYIWTGFTMISTLMILLFPDMMVRLVGLSQDFDEQTKADMIIALQAGGTYYMIMLLLNMMSLTGAILMWNLKRKGFHFYTIANILLFNMPIIWLDQPFSLFVALFYAVFIGFYAMHLKFMK